MRTPLALGREGVKSCLGSSPEHPDKFFPCSLTLSPPVTAPGVLRHSQDRAITALGWLLLHCQSHPSCGLLKVLEQQEFFF